eukprot:scaffold16593_cov51-Phaeocystis_antarctica.AAC.5
MACVSTSTSTVTPAVVRAQPRPHRRFILYSLQRSVLRTSWAPLCSVRLCWRRETDFAWMVSKAVESVGLEAASSSTRGSGGAFSRPATSSLGVPSWGAAQGPL